MYLIFHPSNNTNVGVLYHCSGYKEEAQAHQKGSMPLLVWSGELTSAMVHKENFAGALYILKPDRCHFCQIVLGNKNLAACCGWAVSPGYPEAGWLAYLLSMGSACHWDGSWKLRGRKHPHSFWGAEVDDTCVGWGALEDSGSLCGPPGSGSSMPGPTGLVSKPEQWWSLPVWSPLSECDFGEGMRYERDLILYSAQHRIWYIATVNSLTIVVDDSGNSSSNDSDHADTGILLWVTHSLQLESGLVCWHECDEEVGVKICSDKSYLSSSMPWPLPNTGYIYFDYALQMWKLRLREVKELVQVDISSNIIFILFILTHVLEREGKKRGWQLGMAVGGHMGTSGRVHHSWNIKFLGM